MNANKTNLKNAYLLLHFVCIKKTITVEKIYYKN